MGGEDRRGVLGCRPFLARGTMASPEAAESLNERSSTGAGGALARNAANLVAGQAVSTVLAVFVSSALGRSLGAEDFGHFYLVTSMAQFAFVVVEWGQPQFVVREVARDVGKVADLLGNALVLRGVGTVLLAAATVLGAWAFGYDSRTRLLAAGLMAAMLPFVLAQAYALVFRGRERMEFEAAVFVTNKASTLGLTLLALGLGYGLAGAIAAQGGAGLVALGMAAILAKSCNVPAPRPSAAGARSLLSGGAPLVTMSIAIAAQGYLDAIVLSKLGSAESIGWFGAAKMILGTLIAPATILGSSAYPRLSRAAGDEGAFRAELGVALRPVLGLAVLGAVGTYLYAGDAVTLIYEASFVPAANILQVYALGLLLLFLDILFGTAVLAIGRPLPLALGKVGSIVASTIIGVALVPYCQETFGNGGIGIALAFCASELMVFLTAAALLPRGTFRADFFMDVARALVAGAITLALFSWVPPLGLVPGAPLCVVAFLALSAATGLVRKEELARVWRKAMRHRSPTA